MVSKERVCPEIKKKKLKGNFFLYKCNEMCDETKIMLYLWNEKKKSDSFAY